MLPLGAWLGTRGPRVAWHSENQHTETMTGGKRGDWGGLQCLGVGESQAPVQLPDPLGAPCTLTNASSLPYHTSDTTLSSSLPLMPPNSVSATRFSQPLPHLVLTVSLMRQVSLPLSPFTV